jgi:hypothetical protein
MHLMVTVKINSSNQDFILNMKINEQENKQNDFVQHFILP